MSFCSRGTAFANYLPEGLGVFTLLELGMTSKATIRNNSDACWLAKHVPLQGTS